MIYTLSNTAEVNEIEGILICHQFLHFTQWGFRVSHFAYFVIRPVQLGIINLKSAA
jgi:hypothetical protein